MRNRVIQISYFNEDFRQLRVRRQSDALGHLRPHQTDGTGGQPVDDDRPVGPVLVDGLEVAKAALAFVCQNSFKTKNARSISPVEVANSDECK
jgi:hypothetical protein